MKKATFAKDDCVSFVDGNGENVQGIVTRRYKRPDGWQYDVEHGKNRGVRRLSEKDIQASDSQTYRNFTGRA